MSRDQQTGTPGRERRRMLRRAIPSIRAAFEAGELRGVGHVKNVSKEGLFLRSDILPQPGSEIHRPARGPGRAPRLRRAALGGRPRLPRLLRRDPDALSAMRPACAARAERQSYAGPRASP
jgi:hypothetical protein